MTVSCEQEVLGGHLCFNTTTAPTGRVRGDGLASWCLCPHPAAYFPAGSLRVTILTARSLLLFSKSISITGSEW